MRPSASASSISLMKMPLPPGSGASEGRPSSAVRRRLLHAVAGRADDLDLDGVAGVAELRGDMVGLPEGELRASRADADRFGHGLFQEYGRKRRHGLIRMNADRTAVEFPSTPQPASRIASGVSGVRRAWDRL